MPVLNPTANTIFLSWKIADFLQKQWERFAMAMPMRKALLQISTQIYLKAVLMIGKQTNYALFLPIPITKTQFVVIQQTRFCVDPVTNKTITCSVPVIPEIQDNRIFTDTDIISMVTAKATQEVSSKPADIPWTWILPPIRFVCTGTDNIISVT